MYAAHQTLKPGYRPGRTGKVFCESPFALHSQQLESISKMSTLPPQEKFLRTPMVCYEWSVLNGHHLWITMIKYLVIRDFRGSLHRYCSLSKCWRGTCSCARMLKGYMGNKRLGTPALKVQSIKNYRSLLRVLHDDCPCSYFRHKSVQWQGIMLRHAWLAGTLQQFRQGRQTKTSRLDFWKSTWPTSTLHLFFFAVFNSSTQNIQFRKNQTHCTYSLCSGCKDKDCKNLAHTSKTRQVKHPKSVLFNRGSTKHVVGFCEFQRFPILYGKLFFASVCWCVFM